MYLDTCVKAALLIFDLQCTQTKLKFKTVFLMEISVELQTKQYIYTCITKFTVDFN